MHPGVYPFLSGKGLTASKQPTNKGPEGISKQKKGDKGKPDKNKSVKGEKGKTKKENSSSETQTDKSAVKSKETLTKSEIIIVNTPRPESPSEGVESKMAESVEVHTTEPKGIGKSSKAAKKKKGKENNVKGDGVTERKKEISLTQEKSKLLRQKTDVSAVSSVKRPGTVLSISGIDSTIHHDQVRQTDCQI